MSDKSIVRLCAEIIAGLGVPYSISGGRLLGAAAEPWVEAHGRLAFGYDSADDVEKALTEEIGKEIAEALRR